MVVPVLVYLALNRTGDGRAGWGIPMATDIAFAVGVLVLLGARIPAALKVLLLALAIVDDIGAIVVIAVAYTDELSVGWLLLAATGLVVVAGLRRAKVRFPRLPGPGAVRVGRDAGVRHPRHDRGRGPRPADAGRALGPDDRGHAAPVGQLHRGARLRPRQRRHPAERRCPRGRRRFEHHHRRRRRAGGRQVRRRPGASALAVRVGVGRLPEGVGWTHMAGVAALAGIGFTVSIFVSGLAFKAPRCRTRRRSVSSRGRCSPRDRVPGALRGQRASEAAVSTRNSARSP